MNKCSILITAISLMIFACGEDKTGHERSMHENYHNEDSSSDHHHKIAAPTSIQLNNGMRWDANAETTQGIENMQKLIDLFDSEYGNITDLKQSLENEFQLIFERCTMTGEAHEQLHNYLLPLKEKLDQLSEANREDQLKNINNYLSRYQNYFN